MEAIRRILVADSNEDYRKNFVEAISIEGDIYIAGETGVGHRLVELARVLEPDLIVMDMILAGMDGMEGMEEINALGLARQPQIWIVSS